MNNKGSILQKGASWPKRSAFRVSAEYHSLDRCFPMIFLRLSSKFPGSAFGIFANELFDYLKMLYSLVTMVYQYRY